MLIGQITSKKIKGIIWFKQDAVLFFEKFSLLYYLRNCDTNSITLSLSARLDVGCFEIIQKYIGPVNFWISIFIY